MAKFYILVAVITVALSLSSAEPPRFRTPRRNGQLRTNFRLLARQEEAPPGEGAPAPAPTETPAPYPPAGVTPEIPFDLPTETEAATPDQTYGPPDPTYGPPEVEAVAEPNNLYGPPNGEPAIEEPAAEEIPPSNGGDLVSQNLIQPRNKAIGRQRARPAPLLLRAAPVSVPANRAGVVEIVRARPILVYTLE